MKFKSLPKLLVTAGLLFTGSALFAQTTLSDSLKWAFAKIDSLKTAATPTKTQNSLTISVDMRVRSEFRHGYRTLPTQDTLPAFFTNQRTRLNFDFKAKRFDFFASVQDTRQWGQQDPREGQTVASPIEATTYPLYLFEVYAEPIVLCPAPMQKNRIVLL